MTETTTPTTRLVPEGKDMIGNLTVAELDMASRRVESDINQAVDNELRWKAFAVLADIWARRAGDERREADFRKLESTELLVLLGLQSEAAQAPDAPAGLAGHTGDPAPDPVAAGGLEDEENPTDSAPASS